LSSLIPGISTLSVLILKSKIKTIIYKRNDIYQATHRILKIFNHEDVEISFKIIVFIFFIFHKKEKDMLIKLIEVCYKNRVDYFFPFLNKHYLTHRDVVVYKLQVIST